MGEVKRQVFVCSCMLCELDWNMDEVWLVLKNVSWWVRYKLLCVSVRAGHNT
jgi:hypothetical protein